MNMPVMLSVAALLASLTACQQSQRIIPPNISAAQIEALREQRCLANVIWHESRGESTKGQKAVADVVANRAAKSGKSVCQIVAEPRQFAWYSKKPLLPLDSDMRKLLTDTANESTITTSDHFYSGKKPVWARSMSCRKLGKHNFCERKVQYARNNSN